MTENCKDCQRKDAALRLCEHTPTCAFWSGEACDCPVPAALAPAAPEPERCKARVWDNGERKDAALREAQEKLARASEALGKLGKAGDELFSFARWAQIDTKSEKMGARRGKALEEWQFLRSEAADRQDDLACAEPAEEQE